MVMYNSVNDWILSEGFRLPEEGVYRKSEPQSE